MGTGRYILWHRLAFVAALALATTCLAGKAMAKFVMQYERSATMVATRFCMSSSTLAQMSEAGDVDTCRADCGSDGSFDVELCNYAVTNVDAVSQIAVDYNVSVVGGMLQSVTCDGTEVHASSGAYVLPAGGEERVRITHRLNIMPEADLVTVTVTSVGPYAEVLTRTFDVEATVSDAAYPDAADSDVALRVQADDFGTDAIEVEVEADEIDVIEADVGDPEVEVLEADPDPRLTPVTAPDVDSDDAAPSSDDPPCLSVAWPDHSHHYELCEVGEDHPLTCVVTANRPFHACVYKQVALGVFAPITDDVMTPPDAGLPLTCALVVPDEVGTYRLGFLTSGEDVASGVCYTVTVW